jgi:hypothetical protein
LTIINAFICGGHSYSIRSNLLQGHLRRYDAATYWMN